MIDWLASRFNILFGRSLVAKVVAAIAVLLLVSASIVAADPGCVEFVIVGGPFAGDSTICDQTNLGSYCGWNVTTTNYGADGSGVYGYSSNGYTNVVADYIQVNEDDNGHCTSIGFN
jgi:hypothetical protein